MNCSNTPFPGPAYTPCGGKPFRVMLLRNTQKNSFWADEIKKFTTPALLSFQNLPGGGPILLSWRGPRERSASELPPPPLKILKR